MPLNLTQPPGTRIFLDEAEKSIESILADQVFPLLADIVKLPE
jgi:hypothetical protein